MISQYNVFTSYWMCCVTYPAEDEAEDEEYVEQQDDHEDG